MDSIVQKARATEMSTETQPVYEDFPFSRKSLFVLAPENSIRQFFLNIIRHKWFDNASMIVIAVNCLFLCFTDPLDTDPNSERNKILEGSEVYFNVIFTMEAVCKIVAMGFCRARGWYLPEQARKDCEADQTLDPEQFLKRRMSYLGDYWNWLDFTVVVIGWLSYVPGITNVSALRTFRVLRPLKTLSSFPGMRIITKAMIDSLGDLMNVGMLCLFFFFIFGIIGVQMYNGTMDGMCFIGNGTDANGLTIRPDYWESLKTNIDVFDGENCALTDKRDWPKNVHGEMLIKEGDGRSCAPIEMEVNGNETIMIHRYCGRLSTGSGPAGGYGPSYGTGSFDNIGLAVLSIFTAITLEGWVDEMYMLFNAFGLQAFTAIYFVLLILVGSMFMLNLALAVIENAMSNATEEEDAAQAAQDEQDRLDSSANESAANLEQSDQKVSVETESKQPGIPFFREIVESSVFEGVIVTAIIANTIVLAMEYHSEDPVAYKSYQQGLDYCNYVFTAVFFLEMVFKLLGLFRKEYFSDGFNCFDFLIVMVSLVELFIELAELTDGGSGLSALRAFRLFRMFKLAKSWEELYKLLLTLQQSVLGVGNAAVLLGVMMFIFVLLGMQLFGKAMSNPDNFDGGELPRANFESFGWSLVTVFQVLTGENWNEVLYNGIQSTSYGLGVIYFVLLNLVGNYIILNIFMAILLGNFQDTEEEEPEKEKSPKGIKNNKILPTNDSGAAVQTSKEGGSKEDGKASGEVVDKTATVGIPVKDGKASGEVVDKTATVGIPVNVMDLTKRKKKEEKKSEFQLNGDAFFILEKDHVIRKATFEFITWPPFDNFILSLIAISSLLLALDEPHLDPDSGLKKALNVLDFIITILFIMEAAIKIVTFGFVGHKHAYLRNNWNQLDFFIVVLSIITLAGLGDSVKSLRSLRALRALRPLRVLNRAPGMKLVVNSIFRALPHIFNVTVVCLLFYVIFGIIGVQNWAGGLNTCSNPAKVCKAGIAIFPDHPDLDCNGTCSAAVDFPLGLRCGPDISCGGHPDKTAVVITEPLGGRNFTVGPGEYLAGCSKDGGDWDCGTCMNLPTDTLVQDCINRAYCEVDPLVADVTIKASYCKLSEVERWHFARFKLKETWRPLPQNFDNVGNALLTVFEISSGEMWPDIMYTVIDVVGPDQPMSENFNKAVALYFIAVQIVCAFLLLNLFVGVVVDQYQSMKDGEDGEGPLMTEDQRMWIETQKLAFSAGPKRKVKRPDASPTRAYLFDVVESREFELGIMGCIILNVVTMAMRKFGQTDEYQGGLEIMNLIFVTIFAVEAAVKLYALGAGEYFARNWNRFDFTIVCLSFVGMAFNLGQFATLLRVGRVARMFRLIQTNKSLRDLFYTLIYSLPSISNVASVTFLLFFIYAAFGMNIFADVKFGENLTDKANFNTFFQSILLLFRMSTGESYNGVMHDVTIQEPFCSEKTGNCGFPLFAPFYFLSFFIFSALLMLNLLVAIILGEYSDQEEQGELYERVSPESIDEYQTAWCMFDPKATGFMPLQQLEKLVMQLPVPLGTRKFVKTEDGQTKLADVDMWGDRKPARKKIAKLHCVERSGKVSFHEVLSGLVASAHADIDLAGLASNPQWTDDLMTQTRSGPANKFIKKAEKESHRSDAIKSFHGENFTVEECMAAIMMQNAYRRHQSVAKKAWNTRQKQVRKQQGQQEKLEQQSE